MKKRALSWVIIFIILFSLIKASSVYAECGVAPEIGCKYYFGNEDCSQIWGARHTCYPPPQFKVCSCDDCQGPIGDRCGGVKAEPSLTPTETPFPTPTVTPSTQQVIPFMGIKLGRLAPLQPLQIFWDFIRNIFLQFF